MIVKDDSPEDIHHKRDKEIVHLFVGPSAKVQRLVYTFSLWFGAFWHLLHKKTTKNDIPYCWLPENVKITSKLAYRRTPVNRNCCWANGAKGLGLCDHTEM